ncbi:MAG: hypothetical protein E6G94_00095 [Alphaproteobacteria bacterium]|nr:MAG: hypothetical protein E6G94_00095 [Alphaproteobacteria bacterium]
MNFQAILLVTVILVGVAAFLVLPSLFGAHAKRRRRKQVAFTERHQSVNLFASNAEPPKGD